MMTEIEWHRRETRRTTEKTNIGLRFRRGEIPEGLTGSLAHGMGKENRRELERSQRFLGGPARYADSEPRKGKPGNGSRPKPKPALMLGKPCQPNRRRVEGHWGVRLAHTTRRRESRSHGEGASRVMQPAKET